MNYVVDIIIPKEEIYILKLNEKLIRWGENVYSCEPVRYVFDKDILFEQIDDVRSFNRILGKELENDDIVLTLKNDIFFDLEYAVNKDESLIEENVLIKFFSRLPLLSRFYVLLIREDEKIQKKYRVETKDEIMFRLLDSLKWSNPVDVLLYK